MIKLNLLQPASTRVVKLVLVGTLLGSLSACTALVLGGAVAGVAMVATDRRTSGAQLEDEAIEIRATSRLKDKFGERGHFNITSFNRRVLLTGEVAGEADKLAAEQLVFQVDNVRMVVNELTIAGMTSTLQQRSNDAYITGLVKASMLEAKDIPSAAFKVVTERSVVYLMGRVTSREADRGTEIARGVNGVAKVVRSFELISEEETKR
jgi:osmotically-inducible protein OsmY